MNKIRQYRTTLLHNSYGLSVYDSNGIRTHNHLARKRPFTQPFSQTGQMIELCYEYLSVQCI